MAFNLSETCNIMRTKISRSPAIGLQPYEWVSMRSLEVARRLNIRCLELLARLAKAGHEGFEIARHHRDLWMQFDTRAGERAARIPVVLLDCHFRRVDWWDRVMRQNYTSAQLELLERYLAAHFYCKSDPLYISKGNMGASGSFQRKTDDGFQLTEYGRAACEMDTTGVLSAIGKRQVAGIAWAGRNRDECYPGDRYGTGSCY